MNNLRSLLHRFFSLFSRHRSEQELNEELSFHLEMETEANLRQGMSRSEARRRACQRLGGIEQVKEAYRDQRGLPFLETLLQDLRFSVRSFTHQRTFTLVILGVMATGIGAGASVFSIVNATLLTGLPYPQSDRLVQVLKTYRGGTAGNHSVQALTFLEDNFHGLENIAVTGRGSGSNLTLANTAVYIQTLPVSKSYFQVIGIGPEVGRSFTAEEDSKGGPLAVVLSYSVWQRYFAGDREALGEIVQLSGVPHTLVGVMPQNFTSVPDADAWTPLRARSTHQGSGFNFSIIGRLKAGARLEQTDAELKTVTALLHDARGEGPLALAPFQSSLASSARPALMMLLAAVSLVLLIACVNTSGLLLARGTFRRREFATRLALGGSRRRLIRQLLTENVLLFTLAGLLGVVLAAVILRFTNSIIPGRLLLFREVKVDVFVLAVMTAVAVACGLLFGLFPARQSLQVNVGDALKAAAGRTTSSGGCSRFRNFLVIIEVALCAVLLIGAGLLTRTFLNLRNVELGFDPENVVTAQMAMQGSKYDSAGKLLNYYSEGLEQLRRLPGVRAVAVTNCLPVDWGLNFAFKNPGAGDQEVYSLDWRYVSSDYFTLLRIPVLSGRPFAESDTPAGTPVALVNETFVKKFYPANDPLGREVELHPSSNDLRDAPRQIVGVVGDIKGQGLGNPPAPTVYVPVGQVPEGVLQVAHAYFPANWLIRVDEPLFSQTQMQEVFRRIDPQQPLASVRTMDDVLNLAVKAERFQMLLLMGFGAIALWMAIAGIYGLIAFTIAQRTRELSIRMALGATLHSVIALVVRRGLILSLLGVALGLAGALALSGLMERFLYGVESVDTITFVVVGVALVAVALLASLAPALRIARMDPVSSLRQE